MNQTYFMMFKRQLLPLGILALLLASCQNYSGQPESQSVAVDTLQVIDLATIVSAESALLGEPREIVSIDNNHFAVYDHAYKKIITFNTEGDKLDEFGNVGEGPGEWNSMSGVADLNFESGHFFTSNQDRFLFDLYDRSGSHIKSILFPQYLNYSHKTLLPDNKLLVATNGRKNALAAIMDLNEEGKVTQKIGSPESEYSEARNFEQERITYSNGKIPGNDLNQTLVAKGKDGYFLFMNALGELRHYSDDGELIMQQEIPADIKKSRFDYVITRNKNDVREHTVMPLEYVQEMKIHDDLIYLLMLKPAPDVKNISFRMLVYNSDGDMLNHYVFVDPENESFLYDFTIGNDNNIYFIDVMKSEILTFH